MYQCGIETVKRYSHCPVEVVRLGFMKYAAVAKGTSKTIIAKGLRLKKYYNPYIEGKRGSGALPGRIHRPALYDSRNYRWVEGHYYQLRLENPKKLNSFDIVCVWG